MAPQLVAADLARAQLSMPAVDVEAPFRAVLDDGNRQGPAGLADLDDGLVAVDDVTLWLSSQAAR